MPMQKFLYHGQAYGFDATITEPGPYRLDHHGQCGLPDKNAGDVNGNHPGYSIPNLISHGVCTTSVKAMPEDGRGYCRTEIRATVENLDVEGGVLTADSINLGIVTVYRRDWYDSGKPHSTRTRVLPFECSLVNLKVKGKTVNPNLPAPFHYSDKQRESYLTADTPDVSVDADIRQSIIESPTRFIHVPNFGRIFFGEWTLLPNDDWHSHVHQISMVRLLLGSPQTGGGSGSGGSGGGSPDPPKT